MIQSRKKTDPVRMVGEHGGDGRAEVVPHCRGTQGTDLADGVSASGDSVDQTCLCQPTEKVGCRLGRKAQSVLDVGRCEGGTAFTDELVEEMECTVTCHYCLTITLKVYMRPL